MINMTNKDEKFLVWIKKKIIFKWFFRIITTCLFLYVVDLLYLSKEGIDNYTYIRIIVYILLTWLSGYFLINTDKL